MCFNNYMNWLGEGHPYWRKAALFLLLFNYGSLFRFSATNVYNETVPRNSERTLSLVVQLQCTDSSAYKTVHLELQEQN